MIKFIVYFVLALFSVNTLSDFTIHSAGSSDWSGVAGGSSLLTPPEPEFVDNRVVLNFEASCIGNQRASWGAGRVSTNTESLVAHVDFGNVHIVAEVPAVLMSGIDRREFAPVNRGVTIYEHTGDFNTWRANWKTGGKTVGNINDLVDGSGRAVAITFIPTNPLGNKVHRGTRIWQVMQDSNTLSDLRVDALRASFTPPSTPNRGGGILSVSFGAPIRGRTAFGCRNRVPVVVPPVRPPVQQIRNNIFGRRPGDGGGRGN